jgi:hypothetical protein
MIKPRLVPSLMLIAVLLAACAPAATQTPVPAEPVPAQPTATFPPSIPTLDQSIQPTAGPTQDLAPTALPVATSRGPELEATDPTTVSMASGGLQFVEFFEFW